MHIVTTVAAIQKIYDHFVSNFSANDGAENPQPFGLRLQSGEGAVRVFDKARLRPLQLEPRLPDGRGIEQIAAAGSVVPGDLFGGDVVVPSRCQAGRNRA